MDQRAMPLRAFANIMMGLLGKTEQGLKATERFLGSMKPDMLPTAASARVAHL
jgi:hypothetical protein